MEILIRNQNKAVFLSLLLGIFVGLLYDVFKLIRKVAIPNGSKPVLFNKKRENDVLKTNEMENKSLKIRDFVVVLLFDLLYSFLLCPIFCVFTFITVNGQFRWFIFASALFGALLYKGTIGYIIGKAIDLISYAVFRFRRIIFDKMKTPLVKLSTKIKSKRVLKRQKREEIKRKQARKVVFSYGRGE
jgi:hypothetical protein